MSKPVRLPLKVPGQQKQGNPLSFREQVDAFLLSLPLGTSARDAEVEDMVAQCLLKLLQDHSDLQTKMDNWIDAATDLRDIVNDQQEEIDLLRKVNSRFRGELSSPENSTQDLHLKCGYITRQQEIMELKGLVNSLRADLREARQCHRLPVYDDITSRLAATQQQLEAFCAEHKEALKCQAESHREDLEDVQGGIENLQVLADQREQALLAAVSETERLRRVHVATEIELDRSNRCQAALEGQLKELQEKYAQCQADLTVARQEGNVFVRRLQGNGSSKQHADMQVITGSSTLDGRLAAAAACHPHTSAETQTEAPQAVGLPSPKQAVGQRDWPRHTAEQEAVMRDLEKLVQHVPARDSPEIQAIRLNAGAWRRALAGQVDELQATIHDLEDELINAKEAESSQLQEFERRLSKAKKSCKAQLASAQTEFCLGRAQIEEELCGARQALLETQKTSSFERGTLLQQVESLEEQLELQAELESALAGNLKAATIKFDRQREELQAVKATLADTTEQLQEVKLALDDKEKEHARAIQDSKVANRKQNNLQTEIDDLQLRAAEESSTLRQSVGEAERQLRQEVAANQKRLKAALSEHNDEVAAIRAQHDTSIAGLKEEHEAEVAGLKNEVAVLQDRLAVATADRLLPSNDNKAQGTYSGEPEAPRQTGVGPSWPANGDSGAVTSVSAEAWTGASLMQTQSMEGAPWGSNCQDILQRDGGTRNGQGCNGELESRLREMAERHSGAMRQLQLRLDKQEERHLAEIVSMQSAYDDRAEMLHQDLEVKLDTIEALEPALRMAEEQLAENLEQLEKCQNSLADCQEMLEELQTYSERQQEDIQCLQTRLQDEEAGRQAEKRELSLSQKAVERLERELGTVQDKVTTFERQRSGYERQVGKLMSEKEHLTLELDAAKQSLLQLRTTLREREDSELRLTKSYRDEAGRQLAELVQSMQQGKDEYADRIDRLAGQIGEEARRRADAEAKALAYYQAHTQAQARSQEQSESLLRKIFEQEQAIKKLLSCHPDFTPNSRANMLNALSDSSLNMPAPLDGTPQPRALDFGQENMGVASAKASNSPVKQAVAASNGRSSSGGAFRHLHFNPVFREKSPGQYNRGIAHADKRSASQGSEYSMKDIEEKQPSPPGNANATSPNRWIKVGEMRGSPQWRTDHHV